MIIKGIKAIYFSPTGRTAQVVVDIAAYLSDYFKTSVRQLDITSPENRQTSIVTPEDELIVFGVPTYAGRIPNKLLPYIQEFFHGDKSPAVAVVTFGNRNYDSSLTELKEVLLHNGFHVFAAGAFICEHVFSDRIGHGRPDKIDRNIMKTFADQITKKLQKVELSTELSIPVIGNGAPVQAYYKPLGIDGKPAVFLKAKPITDIGKCNHCGECKKACPMSIIDRDGVIKASGTCIKCHACINKCPNHAKHFEDSAFLSHVAMLEENYIERKEPEYFL